MADTHQRPDTSNTIPGENIPLGDRGPKGKTWSPGMDEQGISNRAGDEKEPEGASDEGANERND